MVGLGVPGTIWFFASTPRAPSEHWSSWKLVKVDFGILQMYPFLLVVTFGLEFLHDIFSIPTKYIRCFFVGLIIFFGPLGPKSWLPPKFPMIFWSFATDFTALIAMDFSLWRPQGFENWELQTCHRSPAARARRTKSAVFDVGLWTARVGWDLKKP